MIAWWAGAAVAASIAVVAPEGPIRPSTPTVLHVAAVDDLGIALLEPPALAVSAGRVQPLEPVAPGVHAFSFTPPEDGQVVVTVDAFGVSQSFDFAVEPVPPSRLRLPARMEAQAGDPLVRVLVTGPDLPPPEALQVVVGEGSLIGVNAVPEGLEVRLAMAESTFPRVVPIGVRDTRRDERPTWGGIRLRTRTTIDLQTEPGASLVLTVGKRSYGPFRADATGVVRPVIDQYPGELAAQVVLTDDFGNETRTTLALTGAAGATLVAMAAGDLVPGRPSPVIYLHAVHGDGHAWAGAPPVCQTPNMAALSLMSAGAGSWRLVLPEAEALQDLRLRCMLGSSAEATVRVPVSPHVPTSLSVRVWPEELSSDFPVAEVQALLLDARGERMAVDGLRVWADRGQVELHSTAGFVVRGEYTGQAAVAHGGDVLRARYDLPAGEGVPASLEIGHGPVSRAGTAQVHVRARDARGLPLSGVPVVLGAGGSSAEVLTGPDGWAVAELRTVAGIGPLVIEASTPHREARGIALREAPGRGGPGTADLLVEHAVAISTGRVSVIDVKVTPEILYTGSRAVARVVVHVRDRSGAVVAEEPDEITVSLGRVGPWQPTGDGGFEAEYVPPPGDVSRAVDLTVRAGSASTLARILLEPRPIDRSALFGVGMISNFGEIWSPYLSADVDLRSPLFGRTVLVRLGVGYYSDTTEVDTGTGQSASLRTTIVPITLGLLARGDFRGDAFWGGLGGVVAPHMGEGRFGGDVHRYMNVYPPGLAMIGGFGRRLGTGEVFVEVRATALSSPGGDFAFTGPVGGIATVLGYRVVY